MTNTNKSTPAEPVLSAQEKCLQLVSQPGNSLYYATLFLTPEQKLQLAPLLAFSWRVERIPRFSTEEDVVNTQFSWWTHEIDQAYRQKASHPIAIGLKESCRNNKMLQQHLALLNKYSNDCQIDSEKMFRQFCIQRRENLISFALESLQLTPFTGDFSATASELLGLLDILDGFHRDARHGLFYFPLEKMAEFKLTTDFLLENPLNKPSNPVNQFWQVYLRRVTYCYQKLWQQQQFREHPLALCIIIYAGIRAKAWQKRIKQSAPAENLCYNLRPQLGPLEKFWISWRLKSRWTSAKLPMRTLS